MVLPAAQQPRDECNLRFFFNLPLYCQLSANESHVKMDHILSEIRADKWKLDFLTEVEFDIIIEAVHERY